MKDIVIPTLKPEDIEVKVKKIAQSGTQVLLYKTARTDMEYLDKVFGIGNWQCDYQEIKGNLYCTIAIWDEDKKQWIAKKDCGIESREDGEGNEKKGEASDAFKRAGFRVGIGRELYTSPFVFISASKCAVEDNKKGGYKLKDPFTKFAVSDIEYDSNRKVNKLVIVNEKTGEVVYTYGTSSTYKRDSTKNTTKQEAPKQTPPKKETPKQEAPKQEQAKQETPQQAPKAVVETSSTLPQAEMSPQEKVFRSFLDKHKLDKPKFAEMRANAVRAGKDVTQKKWSELTPDEWIMLIATMENLYSEGFFKEVS